MGLPVLARAAMTAALYRETADAVLLLTAKEEEAQKLRDDLAAILGEEDVLFFPSRELLPYQNYTANRKVEALRLPVLAALAKGEKKLITAAANVSAQETAAALYACESRAYDPYRPKLGRGNHCCRPCWVWVIGGKNWPKKRALSAHAAILLDIYAASGPYPVRLEFFDDILESMRYFDAQSQRSQEKIDSVTVLPAKEMLLGKEQLRLAGQKLQKELTESAAHLPAQAQKKLLNRYQSAVDLLCAGIYQEEMEQFLPYFYEEDICLLDYFADLAPLVLSEPDAMRKTLQQNQQAQKDIGASLLAQGQILPSFADNFYDAELAWAKLATHPLLLLAYLPEKAGFRLAGLDQMAMEEPLHYTGRLEQLKEDCAAWQKNGYRIFCHSQYGDPPQPPAAAFCRAASAGDDPGRAFWPGLNRPCVQTDGAYGKGTVGRRYA